MLLNPGTEEIGHIEMLATAVALSLEGAPAEARPVPHSAPVPAADGGILRKAKDAIAP